uniref:Phosphatidic acid phosphatase type 2/haloperoxidase domain-containing protein n=1 Tax=Eucampia antarctica TaxID=49252 RepID=A0A7S2R8N2_9STRA|mmetsp:Transcript_18689/g.18001  ORF Transcript_18689/g.18001 Transcript_18689/m.18001 type:complete len:236 (+) Transcript_18689:82-789(+)
MIGAKKSFSLTHVQYDESDGLVGELLAFFSLLPVLYTVCLATHAVFGRDLRVAFVLLGGVLTSGLCTILKMIIQEPRPNKDLLLLVVPNSQVHGMPSNHSSYMTFIAVFSILFAMRRCGNMEGPSAFVKQTKRWLVPTVCTFTAIICCYSRIHLGYHTNSQVGVGAIFGWIMAIIWYTLYERYYITQWAPALEQLLNVWDFRSPHESNDIGYAVKKSLDARRKIFKQRQNGWKRE